MYIKWWITRGEIKFHGPAITLVKFIFLKKKKVFFVFFLLVSFCYCHKLLGPKLHSHKIILLLPLDSTHIFRSHQSKSEFTAIFIIFISKVVARTSVRWEIWALIWLQLKLQPLFKSAQPSIATWLCFSRKKIGLGYIDG